MINQIILRMLKLYLYLLNLEFLCNVVFQNKYFGYLTEYFLLEKILPDFHLDL